ncbi:MAG: HU family DNA-binding protein [Bacillales bacterium]|jgi:DNA-binding protein HU-beta|nr:HU family DNA-binding protein [Bacillales bacterium]
MKELLEIVATNANISKEKAKKIVDIIFLSVSERIKKEGSLTIKNFGSFKVKEHKQHKGYDIKNEKIIEVFPSNVITFKPSPYFRDKLNK